MLTSAIVQVNSTELKGIKETIIGFLTCSTKHVRETIVSALLFYIHTSYTVYSGIFFLFSCPEIPVNSEKNILKSLFCDGTDGPCSRFVRLVSRTIL